MIHEFGMTPLTWWLAGLAGAGLTLMLLAAGTGVITGADVGLWFALGVLMLASGAGAWIAVTRPFQNFDNINIPIDGDHGAHDEPAGDSHDEHGHAAPAHH
jgi:hypothetical protein